MAEINAKDKTLSLIIARASLKFGRSLSLQEGDALNKVIGALALLNQAQLLVGRDNKMARRLLDSALSQNV